MKTLILAFSLACSPEAHVDPIMSWRDDVRVFLASMHDSSKKISKPVISRFDTKIRKTPRSFDSRRKFA